MGLAAPVTKEQIAELDELTRVVKSGKCIAFVGAGLSTPDYPTWEVLIERLCAACQITQPEGKSRADVAELAKRKDPSKYKAFLRKEFAPKTPQYRHVYLVKAPFAGYVTTNYDSLIERAYSDKHDLSPQVFSYPDLLPGTIDRSAVHHLHGRVEDHEPFEVVLALSEYRVAYSRASYVDSLLKELILKPLCFIGCSIDDDFLQPMLQVCDDLRSHLTQSSGKSAPSWFMLVEEEENITTRVKGAGITVVRYRKLTEDHLGLEEILKQWARSPVPTIRRSFDPSTYDTDTELPR